MKHSFAEVEARHREDILDANPADGLLLLDTFATAIEGELESIIKETAGDLSKRGAFALTGGSARRHTCLYSDIDIHFINPGVVFDAQDSNDLIAISRKIGDVFGSRFLNAIKQNDLERLAELDGELWNELTDRRLITGFSHEPRIEEELSYAFRSDLRWLELLRGWGKLEHSPRQPFELTDFNIKHSMGGIYHLLYSFWMDNVHNNRSFNLAEFPDEIQTAFTHLQYARNWGHAMFGSTDRDGWDTKKFTAYKDAKGNDAMTDLLEARRVMTTYAKAKIEKILDKGVQVAKGVMYSRAGLYVTDKNAIWKLIEIHQRHGLSIAYKNEDSKRSYSIPPNAIELLGERGDKRKTLESTFKLGFLDDVLPRSESWLNTIDNGDVKTKLETRLNRLDALAEYKEARSISFDADTETAIHVALLYTDSMEDYDVFTNRSAVDNKILSQSSAIVKSANALFAYGQEQLATQQTIDIIKKDVLDKGVSLDMLLAFLHSCSDKISHQPHILDLYEEINQKLTETPVDVDILAATSQINPDYEDIARLLPGEFLSSRYKNDVKRILPQLIDVRESGIPKIQRVRTLANQETYRIIARDKEGLMDIIAGTAYEANINILTLHTYGLYSDESHEDLIIDYITLLGNQETFSEELTRRITQDIIIGEDHFHILAKHDAFDLEHVRHKNHRDEYKLRVQMRKQMPGSIWAVSRGLKELDGNIFALKTSSDQAVGTHTYVYHFATETAPPVLQDVIDSWK